MVDKRQSAVDTSTWESLLTDRARTGPGEYRKPESNVYRDLQAHDEPIARIHIDEYA